MPSDNVFAANSSVVLAIILVLVSSVFLFFFRQRSKNGAKVVEIWCYPIKGCKGISLNSGLVTKTGLEYDRRFMIVDQSGKFVSQRTHPNLALVDVQLAKSTDGTPVLCISSSGSNGRLIVPLGEPNVGEVLCVSVWGEVCEGVDCGEDAQAWFEKYLGLKGCKLVRMPDTYKRPTDPVYAPNGQSSFSDGYPFLIASREGLADLNSRLKRPVTMLHFRPNIVIAGCDQPYLEDSWAGKSIKIGSERTGSGLVAKVVKPCSRCKVPTVDPDKGVLDPENEPIQSMKSFRNGSALGFDVLFEKPKWAKEIFFGQNLDHSGAEGQRIFVGDVVQVLL